MSHDSLAGRMVVVCRPKGRADALIDGLEAFGASVTHLPLIEPTAPRDDGAELKAALLALQPSDWLAFTSASAVPFVVEASDHWPLANRVAAVGPATEAALTDSGVTVAFTSATSTAEALAATLPAKPGDRVVAPLAERAGSDLAAGLQKRGIETATAVAYRLEVPMEIDPGLVDTARAADAVIFTSPSIVETFLDVVGEPDAPVVSIGPRTTAATRAAGVRRVVEADPHNVDGLIAAVINTIGS